MTQIQNLHLWFNLDTLFLLKNSQIRKNKYFQCKTFVIGLSKYGKIMAPFLLQFPGKNDYFSLYFSYFQQKKALLHVQGSESKVDMAYCILAILGQLNIKKKRFSILVQFQRLYRLLRIFPKKIYVNLYLQVWLDFSSF